MKYIFKFNGEPFFSFDNLGINVIILSGDYISKVPPSEYQDLNIIELDFLPWHITEGRGGYTICKNKCSKKDGYHIWESDEALVERLLNKIKIDKRNDGYKKN